MAYKLLLADDSVTIQKVVELVLAEEDFEIKSVSNGEDALDSMLSFRPDIVLADIEMPKINGYQLCEKIKKNPHTSQVPVILLAGAFEPIDEGLASQVGSDDSLVKPFESHELISKINAVFALKAADTGIPPEAEEAGEEVMEVAEETEAGIEAEALEVAGVEEDLWTMEEIAGTAEEVSAEPAEDIGDITVEESVEIQEGMPIEEAEPSVAEEKEEPGVVPTVAPSEVTMPSKEELLTMFEKTIDEKVTAFLSTIDIKESLLAALIPSLKDSMEKVLWEVAPELSEKMLKEILQGSVASLTAEVEKVIWETVPDLASTMISREIEKIKSEF